MNKKIIFAILIFVFLFAGVAIYFLKKPINHSLLSSPVVKRENQIRSVCLKDNEIAEYKVEKKNNGGGSVTIFIKDKNSGKEKFKFQIDNIRTNYHPVEIHNCGIYVIKEFNYDANKTKQEIGYKSELRKYTYNNSGGFLLLFHEITDQDEYKSSFATDFRVDPAENYLVLQKGYPGSLDFSLVIKNLKNLEDVFALKMADIAKSNPKLFGDLAFDDWSRDGRYFWADTHDGAVELGYIRIDVKTWKYELFPAPEDVLGGDALNVNTGYITIHPKNVWYGIEEITNQEKEKRRKEGIGTEFYIQSLITGKKYFVDKTSEPLWYFRPKWISNTELQYTMPSNEQKTFKLSQ